SSALSWATPPTALAGRARQSGHAPSVASSTSAYAGEEAARASKQGAVQQPHEADARRKWLACRRRACARLVRSLRLESARAAYASVVRALRNGHGRRHGLADGAPLADAISHPLTVAANPSGPCLAARRCAVAIRGVVICLARHETRAQRPRAR